MHPPVMVDTSVARFQHDRRGPLQYHGRGVATEGQNVNLVAVQVAFSSGLGAWNSWSLLRTDKNGALIDTVPVPLVPNTSSPPEKLFDVYDAVWGSPYFYVIGAHMENYGDWSDSISFLRFDEDLNRVDLRPRCFYQKKIRSNLQFRSEAGRLWIADEDEGPGFYIYDFAADSIIAEQVAPFSERVLRHTIEVHDGLFVASRLSDRDDTLFHSFIGNSGSYSDLGYAVITSMTSDYLPNSYSILPYRHDSVVVFLISQLLDESLMQYYFLSPSDGVSKRELKTIPIPFLPGSRTTTVGSFYLDGNKLVALTTSGQWETDGIAFYRFDLSNDSLLEATHLPNWSIVADWDTYGYFSCGSSFLRYYKDRDAIKCFSLDFDDLSGSASEGFVLYRTPAQRTPTITIDDNGLLMYFRQTDSASSKLRAFRVGTTPSYSPTHVGDFLTDGHSPIQPYLETVDSTHILLWHEDPTVYGPEGDGGLESCQQRIVTFRGDIPTDSHIANYDTVYQVYPGSLLPSEFHSAPDYVRIGSTIYFSILYSFFAGEWHSRANNYLRAIDAESGRLSTIASYFQSNGRTSLIKYADSLVSLRSQIYCTDPINSQCFSWNGSYEAVFIHNGEACRSEDLWSGHPSSENLPSNVFSASEGDMHYLSLTTYHTSLWAYDPRNGTCDPIFTLFDDWPTWSNPAVYPILTPTANVLIVLSSNYNQTRVIAFDKNWEYLEEKGLTLQGIPIETSEFLYDSASNQIVFAYSSYVPDFFSAPRVFLQSFTMDVAVSVNDPAGSNLPQGLVLHQNHPNPFNSGTQIEYIVPSKAHLDLSVYNILGQHVKTLVEGEVVAGEHITHWNGTNASGSPVSTGVYIYRLRSEELTQTKKMILLK